MKVYQLIIAAFLLICGAAYAQTVERLPQGLRLTTADNRQTEVLFLTPEIVRIMKSPTATLVVPQSVVVTLQPQQVAVKMTETASEVTLTSKAMTLTVDKQTGRIVYRTAKGDLLLREKDNAFTRRTSGSDQDAWTISQTYTLDADEPIYGLGILQEDKLSKRGTSRYMIQANQEDYVPFIQSLKGWGLYWDNASPTHFDDNASGMTFASEVGQTEDYYFMLGGSIDGTNARMRQLTGEVPMMPRWTFGFFQSKERYKSWAEVQGVVNKYRELHIPLDCIVQDWQYWGSHYLWNAMDFLTGDYAHPKENIDQLHQRHARLLTTVWESFGPQTEQYREMQPQGMLFDSIQTWPQSGLADFWPPRLDYPSGVRPYDVYNSKARDIFWKYLSRMYNYGVDGWWMDSTEPDHIDFKDTDLNIKTAMGSWRSVRNLYPLMAVEGVYKNQRKYTDQKRVTILTRCAFAGQQRTGANTWSGDVGSSWQTLRTQLPAGLNFSMSANPNFNSDIGGFFAGAYNKGYLDDSGTRNPLYQELYVRWMQFGLFNPMMRSHGTEVSREFYKYGRAGEPVYDALVAAVRMRYRMLPYIYSMAWDVTHNHGSYMRALVSDFPEDQKVWNMAHEYMFGKSLLVAPIVNAQYTPEKTVAVDPMSGWDRKEGGDNAGLKIDPWTDTKTHEVYLPKGARWTNYWTNETLDGGQTVTLQTQLSTIPLFVREGSILPVGRDMEWSDQLNGDSLTLKVYPGRDATFTLYEDEGDGYNYERCLYSTITFLWNDRTRQLTIGQRRGTYPGMLQRRTFFVRLHDGTTHAVAYRGKKVTVKL